MVNRSNFERLRGFGDGQTDRQTDGRTFAILESLLRLKRKKNIGVQYDVLYQTDHKLLNFLKFFTSATC